MRNTDPIVALVLADPQAARCRAERDTVAGPIYRQRMTVNDVIGMRLRQSIGQSHEALGPIARARDNQPAIARDALLVLDLRHEPRRVRIARMQDHREPEGERLNAGDLRKRATLIGRNENAVVVPHPHAP